MNLLSSVDTFSPHRSSEFHPRREWARRGLANEAASERIIQGVIGVKVAKVSYLFGQFIFWLLVSIPTVILASLTYFGFSSIWRFATADLAQERKDYLETAEALCRQLDDPQTIEACLEDRYKGLIAESVYAFGA